MPFEWKDIGSAIAGAAPTIGGIVGGVLGATPGAQVGSLAGNAISSLLKSLGLADNSTPDQVMTAIQADPNIALKLRQAEMDYQLAINKQKLDETLAYIQDVQNARGMMVETTKATGKRDTNLYVLSWVIVVGFFGLIALLFFVPMPKDSNGVIVLLFGSLAAGFGSVIGYFFGSSKGSAEKTQLLAKAEPIKNP
jgi:hypothetical protein